MSKILTPKRWSKPASIAFSLLFIAIMCFALLPSPVQIGNFSLGTGVAGATTLTGLAGYWKLDESSGNAADALGTNTLVNTNTATYEVGKIGNCVLTNPSGNKYLTKANPTGLPTGSGNATINFWAKHRVTQSASVPGAVCWGQEANYKMCGLGFTDNDIYYLGYSNDCSVAYAYPTGTWEMYSVTVNGTTKKVNFYANGVQVGTEQTLANTPNVGTAFVCIGAQRPGNLVCFDGNIDEASIWSRVLTASELWQLFDQGNGLAYPLTLSTHTTRHFLDGLYQPANLPYLEPSALVTDSSQIDIWFSLATCKYSYSTDGVTWATPASLVFTGGPTGTRVGGHMLKEGSIWYYYLSNYLDPANPRICVFTSTDKINFTYQATCITGGAAGDNDQTGIANMFVWKEGTDDWRMLYEANDGGDWNFHHICYATATSPTQTGWTKYQVDGHTVGVINGDWTGNPEMPRTGGNTIVKKANGNFVVYVQQVSNTTDGMNTPVGRYSSSDCITWTYDGPVRWLYTVNPTWAVGQVAGTNWTGGDQALCEFQGHTYMFRGISEQVTVSYDVYQIDNHTLAQLNELPPSMDSPLSSFTYRKQLKFNTSATGANIVVDASESNFPICVHINTSSWPTQAERDNFLDTNSDGKRIQFFDADLTTNLRYELAYFSNVQGAEEAIYWVRVPSIAGNSTTDSIWAAFGNDPNGANMDNPFGVWDSNYQNVYHFASPTADSTANTRTLTKTGTVTTVAGLVGNAASADWGATNRLDGSSFQPSIDNITYETSIKKNGAPTANYSPVVMSIGITSTWVPRIDMFITKTTGLVSLYSYNGAATSAVGITNVCDNTWRHIAVSRASTVHSVYVNGTVDGTPVTGTVRDIDYTTLRFGKENYNTAGDELGTAILDEARISNIARSADWIKLTYYSMLKTNFNGDNGVSAPFISWGAAIANPADISNTPSSWSVGVVQPSQTYWANGVEPDPWPLEDADCWGNITNNSYFLVDISASMTDMIGGTTWGIGSSPGTNVFTLKIGIAGLAGVGNFTTLSGTPVAWITSMAAGNMTRWTMVFYTPTNSPQFADGTPKSGNMTFEAEAS